MRINANNATFDGLIDQINETGNNYDIPFITKAYELAKDAHSGQFRRSGRPYIEHPIAVASILVDLGMDSESIVAALLHDVVEDTDVTKEAIEKQFGKTVARLVDGLTKLEKIPLVSREERQAENIRKMLIAMDEDIRVIIIKLADRLHNMNTLDFQPEQKQRDIALETLEIYAPIAHRLGIRAMKEELEDLSIRHLDPIAYTEIEDSLATQKEEREEFLKDVQKRISERLEGVMPNFYIEGRVKSVHGIYRKMYMQGKSFEEIYDVYAVRIIVDTVIDCYNVLGIMHDMFSPIPGRFKDYISTPKPNNYQSLHTTVISGRGIPFEIQIRTWKMHQTAEYGIAAHWKYKAGISGKTNIDARLAWIRKLLESQKDVDDVEEIVRTIKTDLAPEEVFAITPRGEVKSLPSGSTVIDFAYAIHSAVGNRMVGAKVDGRIVPIDYVIKTGDVIEILTTSSQGHGPSRDWLKIVRTSEARNKIRSWFKKERRAENIVEGKAEVDREFVRNKINLSGEAQDKFLQSIAARQHCATVEDFYAMIGYGGIVLSRLMPRIKEDYLKQAHTAVATAAPSASNVQEAQKIKDNRSARSKDGVVVDGIDNCLIKLSRCCTPLPGDDIIGFITRGHGVSIHKRDCSNVPRDLENIPDRERWIPAHWDGVVQNKFNSTVQIFAIDRTGLLADITQTLAEMHVFLTSVTARECKGGNCQVVLTVSIESIEHLKSIIAHLKKVKGVLSVERG